MAGISVGEVILGKFRVDGFVSSGGMGTVFKVYDLEKNVPVAMKVLRMDLAEDPSVLKLFKREANALKKLAHPNIVPFYGLYQTPDFYFLVELFIDGYSLKEVMKKTEGHQLPIDQVLVVAKVVCAALGYAHAMGVVHCDVKPENVMVDRGGGIFLTDFGIARHAESTQTTLGDAGTPAYMAPEQIQSKLVTPATDVYSLGILLFELLTGKRPFTGSEKATESEGSTAKERVRYAHVHFTPPDPRDFNPSIPEELAKVILKSLEKNPKDRYQTASEFYNAIVQSAGILQQSVPDRLFILGTNLHEEGQDFQSGVKSVVTSEQKLSEKAPSWLKEKNAKILIGIACTVIVLLVIVFSSQSSPRGSFLEETTQQGNSIIENNRPISSDESQKNSVVIKVDASDSQIADNATSIPLPTHTKKVEPTRVPTSKPTRTPTLMTYLPIPGCAKSRIHEGDLVMISLGGGRNAIRNKPDTHPTDNVVGYAEEGELIEIIGGPECNYGWLLWKVKTASGLRGWTPETNGSEFWLVPIEKWNACSGALPSNLRVGDHARITIYPPISSRVRSEPGLNGSRIGSVDPGEEIVILDGPECQDNYVWWKIKATKTGLTGWAAEGDSQDYYIVPIPK